MNRIDEVSSIIKSGSKQINLNVLYKKMPIPTLTLINYTRAIGRDKYQAYIKEELNH